MQWSSPQCDEVVEPVQPGVRSPTQYGDSRGAMQCCAGIWASAAKRTDTLSPPLRISARGQTLVVLSYEQGKEESTSAQTVAPLRQNNRRMCKVLCRGLGHLGVYRLARLLSQLVGEKSDGLPVRLLVRWLLR